MFGVVWAAGALVAVLLVVAVLLAALGVETSRLTELFFGARLLLEPVSFDVLGLFALGVLENELLLGLLVVVALGLLALRVLLGRLDVLVDLGLGGGFELGILDEDMVLLRIIRSYYELGLTQPKRLC